MKKELTRVLRSRYTGVRTEYIVDLSAAHATITSNGTYNRIGFNPDNKDEIVFVDFEGGPMLSIGDNFNGRKIKQIQSAYVLTLE